MTVADGTGIEQGTVGKATDPNTFSATNALNDLVGGVAAREKVASDGQTKLAVFRGPGDIFKATASGSIAMGDPLGLVGADGRPNLLRSVANVTGLSGSRIIGTAMETAADGDTFRFELNIQNGVGF